jgi:hypothetical protein
VLVALVAGMVVVRRAPSAAEVVDEQDELGLGVGLHE